MSLTLVQVAGGVGRKVLIATILGMIGLIVGFGCVLLPPVIPFGIVGIAALLMLWIMPDLANVPDRWARTMVPIVLFVFTCVPVYYAIILPDLPWVSLRRATLVAWLIPLFIVIAGSRDARHRILSVVRASTWLSTCTIGFMAISLVTLPTAIHIGSSFSYVALSFLNWFIPMFGIIICVRDKSAFILLFRAAILAVFVNFFAGAIESYLHRPFLIYALPAYMREQVFQSNPILAGNLVNGMGMRAGSYRASATFTTALSWGETCAMIIPFSLYLVSQKGLFDKCLGLIGTILCVLSIALSGSRGAYVGMIVAVVSYSICWSIRSTITQRQSLAGKIGLTFYTMATGATLLAVMFVGRVHRAVLGGGEGQLSTQSRYVEWALAEPKILAKPIFGYGGGSAGEVINYISMAGAPTVDGYYMNLLVDYGVPGLILFFSAFLIAAFNCCYIYTTSTAKSADLGNPISASILAFVAYRTTLSQNDSLTFSFMLLGLTMVYSYTVTRPQRMTRQVVAASHLIPA